MSLPADPVHRPKDHDYDPTAEDHESPKPFIALRLNLPLSLTANGGHCKFAWSVMGPMENSSLICRVNTATSHAQSSLTMVMRIVVVASATACGKTDLKIDPTSLKL